MWYPWPILSALSKLFALMTDSAAPASPAWAVLCRPCSLAYWNALMCGLKAGESSMSSSPAISMPTTPVIRFCLISRLSISWKFTRYQKSGPLSNLRSVDLGTTLYFCIWRPDAQRLPRFLAWARYSIGLDALWLPEKASLPPLSHRWRCPSLLKALAGPDDLPRCRGSCRLDALERWLEAVNGYFHESHKWKMYPLNEESTVSWGQKRSSI